MTNQRVNPSLSYLLTKRIEAGREVHDGLGDRAVSPNGTPYAELTGSRGADEAFATFEQYAAGKVGKIRWRVPPELASSGGWYMRLVIE